MADKDEKGNPRKFKGFTPKHFFVDEPFDYGSDGLWPAEVEENLRYEKPLPEFNWEETIKNLPFEFKNPDPDIQKMRELNWNPPYPINRSEERLLRLNQKLDRYPEFDELTKEVKNVFPGIELRPSEDTTEETPDE